MTVLNLMLGRKAGGLEQAALDYAEALRLAGIPALTVTMPDAWALAGLRATGVATTTLRQMGGWDPLAALRLKKIARTADATVVICHGNRALTLALAALSASIPVIAVAHNYQTRRFRHADACFCITEHLRQTLVEQGIASQRLFFIPNMVRLPERTSHLAQTPHTVPVIGSMGRFVAKKGFELYLEALSHLAARGVAFKAVLGGDGEERGALQSLIAQHGLSDHVQLTGWVTDKAAFFNALDLFVLPSHHEPFGIVLIEAMAHGVPVISTASVGPREIIRDGEDGMLSPLGDARALADDMAQLLAAPIRRQAMAQAAFSKVRGCYSMEAMAARLQSALGRLYQTHERAQHS